MITDFRRRFWFSPLLTLPVFALSPKIQHALDVDQGWRFAGDAYILSALSWEQARRWTNWIFTSWHSPTIDCHDDP